MRVRTRHRAACPRNLPSSQSAEVTSVQPAVLPGVRSPLSDWQGPEVCSAAASECLSRVDLVPPGRPSSDAQLAPRGRTLPGGASQAALSPTHPHATPFAIHCSWRKRPSFSQGPKSGREEGSCGAGGSRGSVVASPRAAARRARPQRSLDAVNTPPVRALASAPGAASRPSLPLMDFHFHRPGT